MLHHKRRLFSAAFLVSLVAGCESSVIEFKGEHGRMIPEGQPGATTGASPTMGAGGAKGDAAPDTGGGGSAADGKADARPPATFPDCDQSCADGPCVQLSVVPRTIVTSSAKQAIVTLAAGTDGIYFGTTGRDLGDLRRVPFDGGDATVIASGVEVLELLVDGDTVFFVDDRSRFRPGDTTLPVLKSVGTNGGVPEVVASDLHLSYIQLHSSYVYYATGDYVGPILPSDGGGSWRIVRLPRQARDGAGSEVLVEGRATLGFAVDDDNLYWTEIVKDNTGSLFRRPLAGGETTTLATSTFPEVMGRPFLHGDHVYFFFGTLPQTGCKGGLARMSKKGGAIERISHGNTGASSMQVGLAIGGGFVYWSRPWGYDGWLLRAPIAGGNPEIISTQEYMDGWLTPDTSGIAATAAGPYWIVRGRTDEPYEIRTLSK